MTKNKQTHLSTLGNMMLSLVRYWWVAAIAATAVALAVIVKSFQTNPPVQLNLVHNTRIDITPEEIRHLRALKQWEFLSLTTEELVEWHREGTFSDDHLARIYSGTLRLGIDLDQAPEDWLISLPDSACQLRLPPITLLDSQFIDEAHSRSFYEKGSIPPQAREELYQKARQAMLRRCLTPHNLQIAEEHARTQFTQVFSALGFKKIEISFIQSNSDK